MKGTLYFCKCDKRYLNKDRFLEVKADNLDIEILEDSSVINPRLKLSLDSKYMESNYIYLEDLHRWYFITNVTLSNGYAYVDCHVDVLYSYREEIKKFKCILARSTNDYNMYQNDDRYNLLSYPSTRTLFIDETKGFDMNINEYVLGTIGNVSS